MKKYENLKLSLKKSSTTHKNKETDKKRETDNIRETFNNSEKFRNSGYSFSDSNTSDLNNSRK